MLLLWLTLIWAVNNRVMLDLLFKSILSVSLLCSSTVFVSQQTANASENISYQEFIASLERIALDLEESPIFKQEFQALRQSHSIADHDHVYREFVRVRMVFEATRDSGLWQIRWSITDREPNSDSIWRQWSVGNQIEGGKHVNAIAECDEISALFAFIVRDLGVKNVGLFWPTSNHTVAVWVSETNQGKPVRVVVPTTQIFLSPIATLGTDEFDPYKQKNIYNYGRQDISDDFQIPADLAKWMIAQLQSHVNKSAISLQVKRNNLSKRLGGS